MPEPAYKPYEPAECDQLLNALRKAQQDEHGAVTTYKNIIEGMTSVMATYSPEEADAIMGGKKMIDYVNKVIDHIMSEELQHEQELNDLILEMEEVCGGFDTEKIMSDLITREKKK